MNEKLAKQLDCAERLGKAFHENNKVTATIFGGIHTEVHKLLPAPSTHMAIYEIIARNIGSSGSPFACIGDTSIIFCDDGLNLRGMELYDDQGEGMKLNLSEKDQIVIDQMTEEVVETVEEILKTNEL